MVLLPGLSQVCPPPSTACCLLQVRKVREQQPFSRSGSPRAHQPLSSGLVRRCILWVLKAGQKNSLRWVLPGSDMAVGWLLSLPASNPQSNRLYHRSHGMGRGCRLQQTVLLLGRGMLQPPNPPQPSAPTKCSLAKCSSYRIYLHLKQRERGRKSSPKPLTSVAAARSFLALSWTFPTSCLQNRVWECMLRWFIAGLFPNVTGRLIRLDCTALGSLYPTNSPALSRAALQPHMPSC